MQTIQNLSELEDRLSEPTPEVVETFRRMDGDLIVLGVAGKMGPSLARMARRATQLAGKPRRIIGVARFSSVHLQTELERDGVETIRCDLLDEAALQRLPDAPNVLFLAGMKFGTTSHASLTWAMNTLLPAMVCRRYARSRMVALSTGNVYGFVPAGVGGSRETDAPAPVGEYGMSALGRERMFEHFSRTLGTSAVLVRLNYACDLRYGVLVDLAQKISAGQAVDLGTSWFNTIWQGDANAMILRCFDQVAAPPLVLNLTGPEVLNIRPTCERLGTSLGRKPIFTGAESSTALLSDAGRAFQLFGKPAVSAEQLMTLVADWLKRGGPTLNKPTQFQARDGNF